MPPDNVQESIAIFQGLNAASELHDLLVRTLQAACAIGDGADGRIILYDPNDEMLTVRAEHKDGQLHPRRITTRAAAYMPFVHAPMTTPEEFNQAGRHHLILPMLARGALVGLLHLEGPVPFGEQKRDLLVGLSGYSGIALQNAYLFERASSINRELHLLVEASNAVTTSLDLDDVLNAITRYMIRALHANWCIIADYDAATGSLQHLAENRAAIWSPEVAIEPGAPGHALRTAALAHGQLYRASGEEAADLLSCEGARHVLGVPIHAGQAVHGVLEVYSTGEKAFTQEQVSASVRASMVLASKFDELAPAHLEQARRTCLEAPGNTWCAVFRWNGRTLYRVFMGGYGLRSPRPEFDASLMPNLAITLGELRVAELREGGLRLSAEENEQLTRRAMGLMVALPLAVKGKAVGLIQLMWANRGRRVTRRELGLASSLARQAAIALENARLVRDLQESLEQQRSMQAQLVRAARLSVLGELSATLAHQISNPLTIILGDAEILLEDLEDTSHRDSAEAIFKAGKRARQVVMRILKMARHEDVPERQTINKTLNETLELLNPQVNRRGISVTVDMPEEPLPVMAAAGQLEDIWSNLVLNARDAILARPDSAGQVRIRAWGAEDARRAYVTVSDDGVGISAAKLERVFSPLYTTKPMGQGTGLGLYVVQQILDTLYGDIHIESTVGQGTTVTVSLPLSLDEGLENESGAHSGS